MKTFNSLKRRQTGLKAHMLSQQSYPSAIHPFPALPTQLPYASSSFVSPDCFPCQFIIYRVLLNCHLGPFFSFLMTVFSSPEFLVFPPRCYCSSLSRTPKGQLSFEVLFGSSWISALFFRLFFPFNIYFSFLFVFLPTFLCHNLVLVIFQCFLMERVLAPHHLVHYPGETFNSFAAIARQKKCFYSEVAIQAWTQKTTDSNTWQQRNWSALWMPTTLSNTTSTERFQHILYLVSFFFFFWSTSLILAEKTVLFGEIIIELLWKEEYSHTN